ncbi:MAG: hypothetical protein A4E73_00022 [Syntrophaceae bacterium PtaU1.Bin231]|nr:MAG: hypothetical protein A4E73_00022 [Syntrophaceae bacterium PtaU1.Bin231]
MQKAQDGRQDPAERYEGHVDRHEVDVFLQEAAVEAADVGALDGHNPVILPQLPCQLSVTDIDGVDPGDPFLQEAIGEAARRSPHIEGDPAADLQPEGIQGPLELHPSPADVGMILPPQADRRPRCDKRPRLVDGRPIDQDVPRKDQGLRDLRRRREAALHQQSV